MRLPAIHFERQDTLEALDRLRIDGAVAIPMACCVIDAYLAHKGPRAPQKWAALVASAERRDARLGAFVRATRAAEAALWSALPTDVLLKVSEAGGAALLARLAPVCRDWRAALAPDSVWRAAYPSPVTHRPLLEGETWRQLAREQALLSRADAAPADDCPVADIVAWQNSGACDPFGPAGLWRLVDALVRAQRPEEAGHWLHQIAARHPSHVADGLWRLADRGDAAVLPLALGHGAAPDTLAHGSTPLMFAAQQGHLAPLRLLLAAGADVHASNGQRTALDWALSSHAGPGPQLAAARLLIEAGAPPEHRDARYRSTPLMFAAQGGDVGLVSYLLGRNVQVNATKDGKTALDYALRSFRGQDLHSDVARLLIEAGAPVDHRHVGDNSTPLMFAAWGGDVGLVTYLLGRNAQVDATNAGKTALDFALGSHEGRGPHLGVARLLIEAGAPVDHRDFVHRSTPLMFAAQEGDLGLTAYLLGRDALVHVMVGGRTALHFALRDFRGAGPHLAVGRLLAGAGAVEPPGLGYIL